MMIETAKVVEVRGAKCVVRVDRRSACDKCGKCAFPERTNHLDIELDNGVGAKIGDYVELNMTGDKVLFAGFAVYLIPLLLGGAALWLATLFVAHILFQLLICLGGVAIGYIITVVIDRAVRKRQSFTPVVTKIILTGSDDDGKDSSSDGRGV